LLLFKTINKKINVPVPPVVGCGCGEEGGPGIVGASAAGAAVSGRTALLGKVDAFMTAARAAAGLGAAAGLTALPLSGFVDISPALSPLRL